MWRSKAKERAEEAHDGYHQEVRPEAVASIEQANVEADDDDDAEQRAARVRAAEAEVALLYARIASHDLMPRVVACKEEGMDDAASIAKKLGVPVVKVYRALDLLRCHLEKIREARAKGEA